MYNKIFLILLTLCFIIPAYTQEQSKDKPQEQKKEEPKKEESKEQPKKAEGPQDEKLNQQDIKVYTEFILEDFEQTQYTDQNLSYPKIKNQEAGASIKDQYPAPTANSKKYLGVKFFGKSGDVIKIKPAKDLIIEKYCKEISMWVYGKRFSGELSFILQDSSQRVHRLILGKLDFLEWRKMKIKLSGVINQEQELLNQKQIMKIIEIQYRPGNLSRQPIWQYFYIDDISALVREKYTDRQSDDW